MDFGKWNPRTRPDPPGGTDPEEIRSTAAQALRDENLRHEDNIRRLNKQHEDNMKTLTNSSWKGLGRCFGNWFRASPRTTKASGPHADTVFTEDEGYRFGSGSSGRCLIIWNRPGNQKEDSASLVEGFSRLGFEVQLRENMSAANVMKLLENVTNNPVQKDGSFVCVLVSEGTSHHITSADGKRMKLGSIVEMFNPQKAIGIRHCPKVLLFQCDAYSRRVNMRREGEPAFSPAYNDALVLCSTHSKFLPTLESIMKTTKNRDFQNMIDGVIDRLLKDCNDRETVNLVSTLQSEVLLKLKDNIPKI